MPALPRPCLMVLTDRTLLSPNWTLAQAVAPAITGGANFVLFREADLPSTPRASVLEFVKDGVKGRTPLVVQGEPDWVERARADGVHLEGTEATPEAARAKLGPGAWIGVTVTATDEAAALGPTADYALIHLDWSRPDESLNVVQQFAAVTRVPLVAGPDVPLEHAAECIALGAAGIAVVRAAMSDYDRTGALRRYAAALGIESN